MADKIRCEECQFNCDGMCHNTVVWYAMSVHGSKSRYHPYRLGQFCDSDGFCRMGLRVGEEIDEDW